MIFLISFWATHLFLMNHPIVKNFLFKSPKLPINAIIIPEPLQDSEPWLGPFSLIINPGTLDRSSP